MQPTNKVIWRFYRYFRLRKYQANKPKLCDVEKNTHVLKIHYLHRWIFQRENSGVVNLSSDFLNEGVTWLNLKVRNLVCNFVNTNLSLIMEQSCLKTCLLNENWHAGSYHSKLMRGYEFTLQSDILCWFWWLFYLYNIGNREKLN